MFGFNLGANESSSQSSQERDTFVAPFQLPFLQNLFDQTGQLSSALTPRAMETANQLGGS